MRFIYCAAIVFGASGLMACGAGASQGSAQTPAETAPAAAASQQGKVDFAALEAREAKPLEARPFASKDGSLQGKLESSGQLKVEHHDIFTQVTAPIGSEAPVVCMIYDQDLKVGFALTKALASVTSAGKAKFAKVGLEGLEAMAGAAGVYATGIYQIEQGEQKGIGSLKLFFHAGLEHGVMCLHDELGYKKSFASLTRNLVESLSFKRTFENPRVIEVSRVKLGEQLVGFSQSLLVDMPNGVPVSISTSSRLMPVAPGEVATGDSIVILGLDGERRILTGKYEEYDGAEESLAINIRRAEAGRYSYEGTSHHKPIKGDFKVREKKGLLSGVARDAMVAELVRAKKKQSLKFEDYTPSSDPTRVEQTTVTVDGAARKLTMQWESVSLDASLDEQGYVDTGTAHVGKINLSIERLFRKGAP